MLPVAELTEFCRAVAPKDVAERPLYILEQSALPWAKQERAAGWVHADLDVAAKDALGDRWQGRGFAMVLNDSMPRKAREVKADALHEMGHCLELLGLASDTTPAAAARHLHLTLPSLGDPERRGWIDLYHGPRWIRATLHLLYRAKMLGEFIPVLLAMDLQGLIGAGAYREALGDEPARLHGERITDIIDTPAPVRFSELWDRHEAQALQRFTESLTQPKE